MRIYGNGVGIWTDTTQFHSHNQILDLLKAFEKARSGRCPDSTAATEGGRNGQDRENKEKWRRRRLTFWQSSAFASARCKSGWLRA